MYIYNEFFMLYVGQVMRSSSKSIKHQVKKFNSLKENVFLNFLCYMSVNLFVRHQN
jgi:hypothetical protein